MGLLDDLNPTNLRYLFYAVSPNETTFASIDDVPDYTKLSSVWMALLMLTECLLFPHRYALNDTVTSATSGILYLMFKFAGKYISAAVYVSLYERVHLVSLDPFNPWVWVLCFFTQDFAYYLAHRCMHECGIFWAFHQMHHSSEYYNLSTAMRKGVFLEVGSFGFDLLQAFFIPPQIFLPHKYLNLLYQFWIHTQAVPWLGPLEYVLNTPSAHRVHHGRNPYCIDKNYAGTLIIWDRMFGTYAEEKSDEPISYGLVDNFFDMEFFIFGKGSVKDRNGKPIFSSFLDKIAVIFAPPGYYPGVKTKWFFFWKHLEDSKLGIPEVDHTLPKYNPELSLYKKAYLCSQLVFLVSFVLPFYENRLTMGWFDFIAHIMIIASTTQVFGYYFDNDPLAVFHDRTRCFGILAYCIRFPSPGLIMIFIMSLPCIFFFEKEAADAEEKEKKRLSAAAVTQEDAKPKKARAKKTD